MIAEGIPSQFRDDAMILMEIVPIMSENQIELAYPLELFKMLFEYEIPKYDGDLGQPNIFVPLTQAQCEKKVTHLMEGFSTQRNRQWFTEDTFYALLRLRGIESNASEKYAEAFYGRKIVIG